MDVVDLVDVVDKVDKVDEGDVVDRVPINCCCTFNPPNTKQKKKNLKRFFSPFSFHEKKKCYPQENWKTKVDYHIIIRTEREREIERVRKRERKRERERERKRE